MPAKAPIYLKANGGKTGHAHGKQGKKLRELLSTDMISPPLGDFRHMAHVGRGGAGDMFGDTSFLQQKLAPESPSSPHNGDSVPKVVAEGLATLRRNGSHPKKSTKKRNFSTPDEKGLKADVTSLSTPSSHEGYGPAQSPILQSAISLPLLNQDSTSPPTSPQSKADKKSRGKKTMNNNSISNTKATSHDTGLDQMPDPATPTASNGGPPKPRRIVDENEKKLANGNHAVGNGTGVEKQTALLPDSPGGRTPADTFSDTTSIDEGWSLDLDLGSSLLDDVIGVMDRIDL